MNDLKAVISLFVSYLMNPNMARSSLLNGLSKNHKICRLFCHPCDSRCVSKYRGDRRENVTKVHYTAGCPNCHELGKRRCNTPLGRYRAHFTSTNGGSALSTFLLPLSILYHLNIVCGLNLLRHGTYPMAELLQAFHEYKTNGIAPINGLSFSLKCNWNRMRGFGCWVAGSQSTRFTRALWRFGPTVDLETIDHQTQLAI